MSGLRRLLFPTPARPGRRRAGVIDVQALTGEERDIVLDALEWSDLDSSEALVQRTDSALAQLQRMGVGAAVVENR